MARKRHKRHTFRFTPVVASLGLCLTLAAGLVFHFAEPSPTPSKATRGEAPRGEATHGAVRAWLGKGLDRSLAELKFFVLGGHRPAETKTATKTKTATRTAQTSLPPIDPVARLGIDPTGLREALALYMAGDLKGGDAIARTVKDPIVRTTLAWVALRDLPRHAGFARMRAFLQAHPGWPARDAIEHRMEEVLYFEKADPDRVESLFMGLAPETSLGRLALARAFITEGEPDFAKPLIRKVWRTAELGPALEKKVKAEFGAWIDKADDKARADYLLYKKESSAGLRAAALAGRGVLALAKLRVAVSAHHASAKMFAAVPKTLRSDPSYLFARIAKLRHERKFKEAAALMLKAPHDPGLLVDPNAWWFARRALVRKLLDKGDARGAYRLCAAHSGESDRYQIQAEFQAGWIALRFLHDPRLAAKHFAIAALYARTPISIARAAYWQGRAAEALHRPGSAARAKAFYETAAVQSATYYGQLARQKLGMKTIALRGIDALAVGKERDPSIRVVELLYALGDKKLAFHLAVAAAKHITSAAQLAALAKIIAAQHDAHSSFLIGKILALRRMPIDALAFPIYGVPYFDPVENSATLAVVYAIARQESGFNPHAVSAAGAEGLMQMIATTAASTAKRAGLIFDRAKLVSDAAFNAQLGAAHLGALLAREKDCPILAFAAYNAGGRRVRQWIAAYGDPRSPKVDPVDWVERIPFEETRNYVQRVMENLVIYRARFGKPMTASLLRKMKTAAGL